ncbi:LysM peptidoglycan-binding domain-containing M23 family metallopeptidase [Actinacidiphila alni]|uniref:M23 family metallopeptidase n=1 Tax=Actinacidiphila alni TaxID=380248 RepID=UPI0033CF6367
MPAKGQHRKTRMSRLTRICVAAGTGGVALALPLVGAGIASAAEPAKAPAAAPHTATVKAATVAAHSSAAKAAATTKYDVVSGDSLSKIADSHHVNGGWQRLYSDNKSVIGGNPDLIYPGQHLTLGGHSTEKPAAPAPQKKSAPSASTRSSQSSTSQSSEDTTSTKKSSSTSSASTSSGSSSSSSASGYTKPVGNAAIGTQYHASGANWSSGYHTGVDFLVGSGTDVHAVAAGTVVSAGWDGAYGNDVIIKHADGKYTLYGHLTQALVSAGQSVGEGQQIGISGATGNVTGPHLHFEVRTTPNYGSDIDPVAYLASHGVNV